MIMENLESILEELENFEKKAGDGTSKILEDYIQHIAKTGDTIFPWPRIRHFMRYMLETVMNEFYETCGGEDMLECGNVPAFSFAATRDKLLLHFDTFSGAPFTIQRLCEIMVDPTRHYKRTDKFLRGLEKNVLVVSNVEPGRQRRSEDPQQTLVNGLQEGGLHNSPLSCSPPPSSTVSHHHKRLALAQTTNSILNNNTNNESYSSEVNNSENQVTCSRANGPSGIHRDIDSDEEPPTKRLRTEENYEEKPAQSSEDVLAPQESPGTSFPTASPHEQESSAEGEEIGSTDTLRKSESMKEEEDEEEEAEAVGNSSTTDSTVEAPTKGSNEVLEAQVETSEVSAATEQEPSEGEQEVEAEKEDAEVKEDASTSVSAEASCSSNSPQESTTTAEEVTKEEEADEPLSASSADKNIGEGSPDSAEGLSGLATQEHPTLPESDKEQGEVTSEAAATAACSASRSEEIEANEGSPVNEASRSSHEADSTSQPASNSTVDETAEAAVSSPPSSTTSQPSPDAASTHSTQECVDSNAAAHTTAQSSSSDTTSTTTSSQDPEASEVLTDSAATSSTSALPQSDSTVSQDQDTSTTLSHDTAQASSNKPEKDSASVSCSSSQSSDSEVKDQSMEEE